MIKRALSAVILISILILQTGCNRASSPREALEGFVREMNACRYKAAYDYVDNRGGYRFHDGAEKIMAPVARSLNMVIDTETDGVSSVTITADVTTIDLREVFLAAAAVVYDGFFDVVVGDGKITKDELNKRMVDEIVRQAELPSAPICTTKCDIRISYIDGSWFIQMDSALYAAVTGYLDEANELVNSGAVSTTEPTTISTLPPEEMTVTETDPIIE
ncbi:MAG: hypothetical protein FWE86_05390 [Oscillospiraceae bacterium]|nr:hypothetical protein [Oscillospiraceae bacterium]